MQTPVRYMNMPTNGFAQFYRSSALAQDRLHQRRYDKPVFIAIAEHDSVLDTDYVLDNFNQRFSNPASRLIWYGDLPARAANTPRVEARKDYLPEYRISRFSHMGLLFFSGQSALRPIGQPAYLLERPEHGRHRQVHGRRAGVVFGLGLYRAGQNPCAADL